MQIKILAFGIAKDILGQRAMHIELPTSSTILDLKQSLNDMFPEFTKLRSLSLAVNETYANDDHKLEPEDEVAIIPPVSGG